MPEDGELVGESVINAGNFLAHISGRIVAADELEAAGGLRKNAGCKQRRCVGINHARWNRIAGERLARNYASGRSSTGATRTKSGDTRGNGNH